MDELSELAAALMTLPGVAAATVAPDADGGPGELSIELQPGADEAGVAAHVATILRSDFGIGVDPGGVRVVEDATELTGTEEQLWATVEQMHVVSDGSGVTVTVTLARNGTLASAEHAGPATSAGVTHAVAAATLAAAERLGGVDGRAGGRIEVVDVVAGSVGRTARVGLTTANGERLAGAALVVDDVRQAVIRAVLRALSGEPVGRP